MLLLGTLAWGQGPALTTIADTVYRADGTGASGTVLISWPAFLTAGGEVVAAGNQSVMVGPDGAFSTALAPNVGASPAGTYYTVVFQLDDGTVRTEYWAVGTTSPTTIAAVRTTPGTGPAGVMVTRQYVDSAVANRALDSAVVHVGGSETITGTKQFAAAPLLPAPSGATDAANKGYVDAAVANVGAGNYVAKAGDSMTGPLSLAGDPTSPNQAATRHYVDVGLATKSDLVSGVVPASELGTGPANGSLCLLGNSTWGPCGSSSNAAAIQGIAVSTTAPSDGQVLAYQASSSAYVPQTVSGGVGTPAGITYATTSLNWLQKPTGSLTAGSPASVTLTPCPIGVDTTSGVGYDVFLSGGANSEAALVTGGTCSSGASSGTITFTPFYSYAAGYSVGSASSGLQETINSACGVSATHYLNGECNVTIAASGPGWSLPYYNVQGTIFLHTNQTILTGYGATLACIGRGPCLQIGNLTNSNYFQSNAIKGLSFRSPTNNSSNPSFAGVPVVSTQRAAQVATITTASPHGFRVGDMVTILFTDNNAYWGDAFVTAVPSSTSFQYRHSGGDIALQNTPGAVALAFDAILDNGMNSHFSDIQYDLGGENGSFNNFFDFWDDENATIDHFMSASQLTANANWTGSFIFSAGNQGAGTQIAPVITLRDSSITATNPGATVYNSNGLYIENTVIQSSGPWQVLASNATGNYQGAYLKNVYSESSVGANPLSPARSPFAGTGIAGLIAGNASAAASFSVRGNGGVYGTFPTYGSGAVHYSYFVVAKDAPPCGTPPCPVTSQTSPMQAMNYNSTGSDTIAVMWPRIANQTDTITYDILRAIVPAGLGSAYPTVGNCNGGASTACGSVATNLAQCAGLVCAFTDNGGATTSAYTVPPGNYGGNLIFWPGSVVSVTRPVNVDAEQYPAVGIGLSSGPIEIADICTAYGGASPGGFTSCPMAMVNVSNTVANSAAALMTDGPVAGGGWTLSKGRLNFSNSPWANLQPHHIITLIDSQPALTRATTGYRPAANANDVWIGIDVPAAGVPGNQGQLASGAPISISQYIGNVGDNASWKERLSSTLKEFNVAVKFDQSVTFTTPIAASISGNAGTATASDHTPTPCSSGFASGVDVNWNAICNTADIIQLAETPAPAPVAGYGQLWFSSTNHSPFFITGTGQTAQIGYGNIFNTDPAGDPVDTVEIRNASNAQNLRVYQNYVDATHWNRLGFSYDSSDNGWMVVKSEWGSGNTSGFYGLGFATGSSRKWEITTTTPNQFRPASALDNNADLGDSTHRIRNLYLGTGLVFGTGTLTGVQGSTGVALEAGTILGAGSLLCTDALGNATTAGCPSGGGGGGLADPGANGIVKRTALNVTSPAGASDVNAALGYTAANDAAVAHVGGTETITGSKTFSADTTFTGNVTIGGTLNLSATGPALWQGKQQMSTPTVASGYDFGLYVDNGGHFQCVLSGGTSCDLVGSVFGRTGVVTAQNGDYSVSQVTGAAPIASPTFTGTPGAPTPSAGDNSNKLATTAYVRNETYFAWTCPVAGSTSVSQNCNWTLPANLTITGFDFAANTAPAGCTTYPTVQVWDATAGAGIGSYSITLASGSTFYTQVTGSANVASGHLLRIKVTTAASGCTTNAGGMVATVTYQMQN